MPSIAFAVVTELFRDYRSPLADKAREAIFWYFGAEPKLTAEVGG